MRWFSKGAKRTLRYFDSGFFSALEGRFAGGVDSLLKSTTRFDHVNKVVFADISIENQWANLSQDLGDCASEADQKSGSRLVV